MPICDFCTHEGDDVKEYEGKSPKDEKHLHCSFCANTHAGSTHTYATALSSTDLTIWKAAAQLYWMLKDGRLEKL